MKVKPTLAKISVELTIEEASKLSCNLEGFDDDFTKELREFIRVAIEQCK